MLRGNAFVGFTGGPSADFNMALFGESPDELAVFDEFLSRVKATAAPALVVLTGAGVSTESGIVGNAGLPRVP